MTFKKIKVEQFRNFQRPNSFIIFFKDFFLSYISSGYWGVMVDLTNIEGSHIFRNIPWRYVQKQKPIDYQSTHA